MRPLSIPARLVVPVGRLALVLLAFTATVHAQDVDQWRAYPSYNEVRALASSDVAVWAGTPGGIFSYTPVTGEIARYTAIEGLRGGDLQTLAFDRARNVLWAGYADGAIDRLDATTGTITNVLDVTRAVQYASRGIRRIRVFGDSLYLATDFGVVVYDPVAGRVRNTYARLGSVPAGTPVEDVLVAPLPDGTPGVWVATPDGVVRGPRDGALQSPTPWTVDPGFNSTVYSLGLVGGQVHLGGGPAGAQDLYRRESNGDWSRLLFTDVEITEVLADGDAVLALDRYGLSRVRPGQPRTYFRNPSVGNLSSAVVGPNGVLWVSDEGYGLLPLPSAEGPGEVSFALAPIVPTGPFTTRIADLDVGPDGTLWVATRQLDPVRASAIGRFDGTTWTNYLTTDSGLDIGGTTFRYGTVGPDGRFYAGGDGIQATDRDGLTVVTPDGSLMLYNESNSSLMGASAAPTTPTGFVITTETAFEGDLRWVINADAARQLHLFDAADQWTALPTPSGILTTSRMLRLVVDGFGTKWIALDRTGIAVWDTGADPADPADDRGRSFTTEGSGGQGLPNIEVRALAVDGRGRVWIGTGRGIAYVFSPGSAFGGDPSLATPQWPIVIGADGDDDADYLLRDVVVNDMAVDPAGRVWVATGSGAYLLNADGNDLDRQIDSRNSPLPSDDIQRIAVDPSSGRIYFVTTFGLYSVAGDASQAVAGSEALTVAPNPFRPADAFAQGVLIGGLNAATTSVRILTVAGEVVHSREAAGGSFRWDGRDDRTGDLVASGVYIVAAASETGATIYGKVAVIR